VWDVRNERICAQQVHWWAGSSIEADERRCHQPLRRWLAERQLREMPGEVHDMTVIESQITLWKSEYSLRHVGVDPLSHQESAIADWRKRGIPVTAVDQGIRTMGPAWALWTDALRSQRLQHQRDDVLRHCLSATRTIEDNAGNVRPVKGRSAANIDAVVAACMAMLLVERFQLARTSSYEAGSAGLVL
jgi:phage terminase large subunit-like protein